MNSRLRVTLLQTSLVWENIPLNIRNLHNKLEKLLPGSTDLVVLPEMFSTGFSMRPDILAEKMQGSAMQWMADTAASLRCVLSGSLMLKEGRKYYNRLIFMRPDGNYEKYDKRHLFRMGNEGTVYTRGSKQPVFELNNFRILPQVCYDLRFPVWSRNQLTGTTSFKYDILLYVANWPAVRSYAWQQLLIARAIENQAYVVAVNRTGKDGNGIDHAGGSCVVDPLGNPLYNAGKRASVKTVVIYKKPLEELRKKFPVLKDADSFRITS